MLVIDSVEWRVGARKQLRFADAATNLAQGGLAVVGLDDDPSGHVANGFDDTTDSPSRIRSMPVPDTAMKRLWFPSSAPALRRPSG